MYKFYLMALIPMIIGLILLIKSKRVNMYEWIIGTVCAFIVAGIFHIFAIRGLLADTETWSGQITLAKHYAAWQEYYEEAVYDTVTETHTDSEGNTYTTTRQVFSHWDPETRWHRDEYTLYSNINTEYDVNVQEYKTLVKNFGSEVPVKGKRTTFAHASRMIAGDPNDYESRSVTGYIYPVTSLRNFDNRIKAAPSTFSYVKVPTNIFVYEYPKNSNWRVSDRLLGEAKKLIDIKAFDDMNARLGPVKLVNVIMVGYRDKDSIQSNWQEAKWIGGKKNDLIICFNMVGTNVTWVKTFGWTEREICKRNIDTIMLTSPINTKILSKIEKEIRMNYMLKDWHKFDYITIEPTGWCYFWFIFIMVLIQAGLWVFFIVNEYDKEEEYVDSEDRNRIDSWIKKYRR